MTAASYTTRLAPPVRTTRRWTHLLALLGVCLPVPICAVSGLSLPLPATVARIAASLVPWADGVAMSANEALHAGEAGSVVAGTGERSGDGAARLASVGTTLRTRTKDGGTLLLPQPGVGVVPPAPGIPTVPGSLAPVIPDQGTGRTGPVGADDPTASAGPTTPGESPTPAPALPAPTPTEPAPPPAQSNPDPVAAVKPVVDEVLAPVTPILDETTKTVEEVIAPVLPVLPGLGK
jgi:hypothetical protein